MSAPDLWTLAARDWSQAPGLDVAAGLALVVYVAAARRVRRGWPWPRTVSFAAGLLAIVVALQSGLDGYDDRLLSAHMLQHLLLLELAPLLLLGGHPAMLALRATAPGHRPPLARLLRRGRTLTHPATCLTVFCVVVLGTHVPAFYDATLRDPPLHELEHALYLAAGLLVWWPVLDGDPVAAHRLDGLRRLAYVLVAMVPMTVLGAWLNRATGLVYSGYGLPARELGISAVVDQQRAGAIMWVLGSVVMIVAGIWQAMAAFAADERRQRLADRRLDALDALGAGETRP